MVPELDPGDVEHLVDQLEEVGAALDDLPDALLLGRRQVAHLEHLGEPENRVERRAQLVADARQELVSRLMLALGLLLELQFFARRLLSTKCPISRR